jgi:outer membrane protein assembly factor BamB
MKEAMTQYLKNHKIGYLKDKMFKITKTLLGKLTLLIIIVTIMLFAGACTGLGSQQAGWSGVIVADGNVYFGSGSGNLIALDTESGGELWRKPFTASGSGGFGCAPSDASVPLYGTPVVDGELVYISGYDGKIYALNTSAGAERWIYPRQGNLHSFVGGLVLDQGKLYIGSVGGIIYSLNAETGDLIWQLETGEQLWATPAIDSDTLYIGSFSKKLYAIDTATGEEKWQKPFETEGPIISTPLVDGGVVYIGSFDRHIYALDTISGEVLWQFPKTEGNGENTPQKWFWASPVMYNGTIYAANTDGRVYLIDSEDGNLISVVDLGKAISSTPAISSNRLYVATEDGDIFYIDTIDNDKTELPPLAGKVRAPLVADDGIVYIHTIEDEIIYKLNAETGVSFWNLPISKD